MNNYLIHYGVKGMRWGVRKRPVSSVERSRNSRNDKIKSAAKKVAIGAAIVGGTALTVYGGYKISQINRKKFTPQRLREMGISTFDYETFSPETFDPVSRISVSRAKVNTTPINRTKVSSAKVQKIKL